MSTIVVCQLLYLISGDGGACHSSVSHLVFCHALGLGPVNPVPMVLLIMCYAPLPSHVHSNHLCVSLLTKLVGAKFTLPVTFSFLILSFPVFLKFILVFLFLVAHYSLPHTIAGLTTRAVCFLPLLVPSYRV